MCINSIENVSLADIREVVFDVALFSSGYESRCINLAENIPRRNSNKVFVLGFNELASDPVRLANDEWYDEQYGVQPIQISGSDDKSILGLLSGALHERSEMLRIFIDYSSMSRIWYASILNWVRHIRKGKPTQLYFGYSHGVYSAPANTMIIRSISAIPGCEGSTLGSAKTLAVFGLGYQGFAALCVMDRLEPDKSLAFVSAAPENDLYAQDIIRQVYSANDDLLKEAKINSPLSVPVDDVPTAYRFLTELIVPYLQSHAVRIIPMGPKPHTLVAMLLAIRFPEIACLHISGQPRSHDVKASGNISIVSIGFK